ncbi:MAG: serine hydrolase [Pseudomonadota bacterium]
MKNWLFNRIFVAVVLLCAAASGFAQQTVDWDGLWVAEHVYGPHVDGSIQLVLEEDQWIARVRGEYIPVTVTPTSNGEVAWHFSIPDYGQFDGWQTSADDTIVGHWIQPAGQIANYPIATPVILAAKHSNQFVGLLKPYIDRVSLNIPLRQSDTKDVYASFLRNPERNFGVFFRIDSVVADEERLHFRNPDGAVMTSAQILVPGERFALVFGRTGETLEFSRRGRDQAPGFFPRRFPVELTSLPVPASLDDGWETAEPMSAGLDEDVLLQLVNELAAFEPEKLQQPYVHAILVAHKGTLVLDEYFHGFHADATHDSRSAGKSLTSALLGMALFEQSLESIDQPVYPLFGGVDQYKNESDAKEGLSLRHLVTMTSGLDCDDGDYDSPGNEDVMQSQSAEPDWYRYALNLALVRQPGSVGIYCTAGINLIGGAIEAATGEPLIHFFKTRFADPLGIAHYEVNLMPTLSTYMGGGIRLRPRDFLKLGQLYLNGGVWNGERLLSEAYVQDSMRAHSSINEQDDYGFAWWRKTYSIDGVDIDTFYASGNGGQLLFIVPTHDLVVLIQAGNYSDGSTRNAFRDRFMTDFFLRAVIRK